MIIPMEKWEIPVKSGVSSNTLSFSIFNISGAQKWVIGYGYAASVIYIGGGYFPSVIIPKGAVKNSSGAVLPPASGFTGESSIYLPKGYYYYCWNLNGNLRYAVFSYADGINPVDVWIDSRNLGDGLIAVSSKGCSDLGADTISVGTTFTVELIQNGKSGGVQTYDGDTLNIDINTGNNVKWANGAFTVDGTAYTGTNLTATFGNK